MLGFDTIHSGLLVFFTNSKAKAGKQIKCTVLKHVNQFMELKEHGGKNCQHSQSENLQNLNTTRASLECRRGDRNGLDDGLFIWSLVKSCLLDVSDQGVWGMMMWKKQIHPGPLPPVEVSCRPREASPRILFLDLCQLPLPQIFSSNITLLENPSVKRRFFLEESNSLPCFSAITLCQGFPDSELWLFKLDNSFYCRRPSCLLQDVAALAFIH